jgi:hypothetical protein
LLCHTRNKNGKKTGSNLLGFPLIQFQIPSSFRISSNCTNVIAMLVSLTWWPLDTETFSFRLPSNLTWGLQRLSESAGQDSSGLFINLTVLDFIPIITFRRCASAAKDICRDVENFGTKTVSHNRIS